jgi:hypothetical protein
MIRKQDHTKEDEAQARWHADHKVVHITNEAHVKLLRHAGRLQAELGKPVNVSMAISDLVDRSTQA